MSDLNAEHNRVVWMDIPVKNLDRASKFYESVLAITLSRESYEGLEFAILEHADGNGGCLVPQPDKTTHELGPLVYLNVAGRIRDAVAKVEPMGGKVSEPIHPIGPHGFRAIILDSEGNRFALHSKTDA